MKAFRPDRSWYHQYWWDEGPSHGPLLFELVTTAGRAIKRMVLRAVVGPDGANETRPPVAENRTHGRPR
ncbi:MAG: hypothetical protein JO328_01495 [Hyphomicrobiales bacterium]|nr:hypothetical protein [Hyphomicrobiales bacterium]